jgi:hypothetical protein
MVETILASDVKLIKILVSIPHVALERHRRCKAFSESRGSAVTGELFSIRYFWRCRVVGGRYKDARAYRFGRSQNDYKVT